jgi:hypothetical protein
MNNRKRNYRFDMHVAFREKAKDRLIEFTENIRCDRIFYLLLKINNRFLVGTWYYIYRPRVGIFAQADHCSKENLSGESIIPTFTCNFLISDEENVFAEADKIMNRVVDLLKTDDVLRENLLRSRFEYQLPSHSYNPEKKTFECINVSDQNNLDDGIVYDSIHPRALSVKGEEYYDAHIHLISKNLTREQYIKAAKIAASFNMPIIINLLKPPKPFITMRWHNTTYESMINSVKILYNCLFPEFQRI